MGTTPDRFRLPRTVRPRRYDLVFEPDLASATFAGTEVAEIELLETLREVVLNAAELTIDEAWLELDGERFDLTVSVDAETERATLAADRNLAAGPARLHTRFRGTLNDRLRGFYRSTFTDDEGDDHVVATTQFESTDARRAFPCWDEPDLKAVFAITMVAPSAAMVLSNAAEIERQPLDDGRVRIRFADTMVMSTYLVAFVVGALEATDAVEVDGVPLRIICPPGKKHLTGFALDVGAFALRYFADYFDIAYPGDKLDLVAIPDFAFGAMENLGCVTFRETLLLVDPAQATQAELRNVARVISHEIAHMWFGDLVTMKWWNGIWLNEAFATLMEVKCTDALRPDWHEWTSFGLARSTAFDTDSLASTRPVEYPVISPADADGMFDVLTYEKGGAVLRMLESYLGEDRFRHGIRHYMREHQYGNTETTDLWDAIEEATGDPVRRVMDSWIFHGGHPVIDVDLRADGTVVHLAQQRFGYATVDQLDGIWSVPVLLRADDRPPQRVLLETPSTDVALAEPATVVRANAGATGFYRVHYPADVLRALAERAPRDLEADERYALVDDAWASVLSGRTTAEDFFVLADAFVDEPDVAVWKRLVGATGMLVRVAQGAARAERKARVGRLLGPTRDRLGDKPRGNEDDRTRELRGVVLEALGSIADEPTAQERARVLLEAYLDDVTSVEPNVAAAAVRVVATIAGRDEQQLILDRFRSASTPQEKQRFLFALAHQRDPDQFAEVLDLSLSSEVRTQDAPYLLREALSNDHNAGSAWRFVRTSWPAVIERFPHNSVGRMLEGIRSFVDPALAADVEAFLAEHPVPQADLSIAQHIERMKVSVALALRSG